MIFEILKDKIRTSIYSSRTNISNNLDKNIEKKLLSKKIDLKYHLKSFGKKNQNKKFYIIQRKVGGGMFSNLNYVLHHIKIAKDLGCIPIIDMKNFPTKYNVKNKIDNTCNAWEYYFEPLNDYKLKDVYKSKFVIICDKDTKKLKEFDSFENLTIEHYKIFKKYIKIKKNILKEANYFIKKNFNNLKVLGVHFRGTDMKTQERHPFPATYKQIVSYIDFELSKNKYNKIFLVTEELNYLNKLKDKYKSKICFYNSYRSNENDIFDSDSRKNHRYLIGRENIIDMLILSNTSKIICTNSHLPDASNFINNFKMKLIKIENGNNSKNLLIAQFLWYIRKILPAYLGGFKLKN